MADQELRDRAGRLIGKIRATNSGRLEGRNAAGQLKGTYDPKSDTTKDHTGRTIGRGNLLAVLITQL
ncbi:MAG TPA: hypothetical protein VFJ58_19320 [Armatimonadota bacterium]|nr:hypothetical protein [Armatimonadota bacterium]